MIIHQQFFYVRHGQTDWNLNKRLQGNADIPLNDTGIRQAYEAKQKLTGQPIATICTSPLQRARKTADIINENLQCPIIEIDGLKECNFGPNEGSDNYGWLKDWLNGDGSSIPPGVEPYDKFLNRVRQALNQAISDHPGPVLIVAHGGVYVPIKMILPDKKQTLLGNGQPVRHDPPKTPDGHWQTTFL